MTNDKGPICIKTLRSLKSLDYVRSAHIKDAQSRVYFCRLIYIFCTKNFLDEASLSTKMVIK